MIKSAIIHRIVRRPSRTVLRSAATALLLAAVSGTALAQQQAAPEAERDARAIAALSAMGKYLRTLKEFRVRSETSKDEVLENGQKLQFSGSVDYRVRQPDRLRAEVKNDIGHRLFFYDGATLTQYAPRLGYYAIVKTPATIAATLRQASEKFDLEVPLADLFFWGSEQSGIEDIREASVIAASSINGVACDHYAFRQDDVDWQIWITRGAKPLPLKLVITTKDEPSQPQFTALFKWETQPKFDQATFAFTPPKGAKKIEAVDYSSAAAK